MPKIGATCIPFRLVRKKAASFVRTVLLPFLTNSSLSESLFEILSLRTPLLGHVLYPYDLLKWQIHTLLKQFFLSLQGNKVATLASNFLVFNEY